ncbi:hypothetical protein NMY22_g1796 [Coprinellus aureogranulatus]|nr:hypothetical protein NMY22_g1796 [Coprinellus aureogranulatus]
MAPFTSISLTPLPKFAHSFITSVATAIAQPIHWPLLCALLCVVYICCHALINLNRLKKECQRKDSELRSLEEERERRDNEIRFLVEGCKRRDNELRLLVEGCERRDDEIRLLVEGCERRDFNNGLIEEAYARRGSTISLLEEKIEAQKQEIKILGKKNEDFERRLESREIMEMRKELKFTVELDSEAEDDWKMVLDPPIPQELRMEQLEALCIQKEQSIMELRDKLSECLARLSQQLQPGLPLNLNGNADLLNSQPEEDEATARRVTHTGCF